MTHNLAAPRLRLRRGDPMRDHDALPPCLRAWAAQADLPWSARSLRRIWNRTLSATGSSDAALYHLTALEAATLAKDAAKVWGPGYMTYSPETVVV